MQWQSQWHGVRTEKKPGLNQQYHYHANPKKRTGTTGQKSNWQMMKGQTRSRLKKKSPLRKNPRLKTSLSRARRYTKASRQSRRKKRPCQTRKRTDSILTFTTKSWQECLSSHSTSELTSSHSSKARGGTRHHSCSLQGTCWKKLHALWKRTGFQDFPPYFTP